MRIQCNIMAMNTHRMYSDKNKKVSKSAEKLSSGFRINRAADDAAGLAISEKMRVQVRGLNMASKNSQDAISLIQTAEGAMQEVHSVLQRMNELANQAATGTNQEFDRQQINAEFDQLKEEITDISTETTFNGMKLLDGSLASGAAKVRVKSGGIAAGASFPTPPEYTVTSIKGLSSQTGTYKITAATGSTKINVEFEDSVTHNKTNTALEISDIVSGDFKKGGAFKLDLSAAGAGVLEITAMSGTTVQPANLAAALNTAGNPALVTTSEGMSEPATKSDVGNGVAFTAYTGTDKTPAGTYKFKSTVGSNVLTITDQNGNSDTVTIGSADTELGLSTVSLGGRIVDLGKYTLTNPAGKEANTAQLFDGVTITGVGADVAGALKIQVGANEGDQLGVSIEKLDLAGLGLISSHIADQISAGHAITATRAAVDLVSEQRATLGAIQNRLEHKILNLDNTSENVKASESRIRDVDIAKEMTTYTKNNILYQAATSILAQANSAPQNVLSLIQG